MAMQPELRDKPFEHRRFRGTPYPGPLDLAMTERGLLTPGKQALISFEHDFMLMPIAASGVTGWKVDNDGTVTTALSHVANGNGGQAIFAPGSTATNNAHYMWSNNSTVIAPFTMAAGKRLWLQARFKLEDADKNLAMIGLHTSQTDPWATEPADQFLFRVPAANGVLQFAAGTTNTTEQTITLNTLADDTWYTVEAFFDGVNTAFAWVWNDAGDLLASGNCDQSSNNRPDGPMTPAFGMEMTDTGADDMTIDYLNVHMER